MPGMDEHITSLSGGMDEHISSSSGGMLYNRYFLYSLISTFILQCTWNIENI